MAKDNIIRVDFRNAVRKTAASNIHPIAPAEKLVFEPGEQAKLVALFEKGKNAGYLTRYVCEAGFNASFRLYGVHDDITAKFYVTKKVDGKLFKFESWQTEPYITLGEGYNLEPLLSAVRHALEQAVTANKVKALPKPEKS